MKFLIVDDSKAMQSILTKAMKGIGYVNDEYLYAFDGLEALETIRQSTPDLVLCDLHMPNMSGIELISTLNQEGIPVKAGIVSIEHKSETVEAAKSAGALFYLQKPFTSEVLFNTIHRVLTHDTESANKSIKSPTTIHLPDAPVFSRLLSSIGRRDIKTETIETSALNYNKTPFLAAIYCDQNEQHRVYMAMDSQAACAIAVLLNQCSAEEANELVSQQRISDPVYDAAEIFSGIVSLLIQSSDAEDVLTLLAISQVHHPEENIKKTLLSRKRPATALSFSVPNVGEGRIVLFKP